MNKIKHLLAFQLSLIVYLVVPFSLFADSKKQYTDDANLGASKDTVTIDSGALTINDISIPLPGPVTNWVTALGRPDKVVERQVNVVDEKGNWVMLDGGGAKKKKRTLLLWLTKGISTECEYAKSLETLHHCDVFNMMIRDEYNPHKMSMYPGIFIIDGVAVKKDTTIFHYRKHRNNKDRYFLFGGKSVVIYSYNVCSPVEKRIGIDVRWSNSRGKDPYEYRLTNVYISAKDTTFDLRDPCIEQLNSPYRSVTEAMASVIFENSDAFKDEKGECDRQCQEKRASFFRKFIEGLDKSIDDMPNSEKKIKLQKDMDSILRLMNGDLDAPTQKPPPQLQ